MFCPETSDAKNTLFYFSGTQCAKTSDTQKCNNYSRNLGFGPCNPIMKNTIDVRFVIWPRFYLLFWRPLLPLLPLMLVLWGKPTLEEDDIRSLAIMLFYMRAVQKQAFPHTQKEAKHQTKVLPRRPQKREEVRQLKHSMWLDMGVQLVLACDAFGSFPPLTVPSFPVE